MSFELTGTLIKVLPIKSGVSQSGKEWQSLDFVIEHESGQYPKRACLTLFGSDKIQQANVMEGQQYRVCFDIDCREWTGKDGTTRWFNSVIAWKIEPANQPTPQPATPPQADPFASAVPTPTQAAVDDSNLPF